MRYKGKGSGWAALRNGESGVADQSVSGVGGVAPMTQQILQAAGRPGGSSPAAAGAVWAPSGHTESLRPAMRGYGGAVQRSAGVRTRPGTAC